MSARPSASELLRTEGALLSRSDLAELGWPRRCADAIFRRCPVVVIEGFSRPMIRVSDYQKALAFYQLARGTWAKAVPTAVPVNYRIGANISK